MHIDLEAICPKQVSSHVAIVSCDTKRRIKILAGNAPMESFFGTLKTECLHHFKFKTRDQARQVVFDYIEVFYNRIRRHVTIQNQVPADYANQFYKNELQIAA